GRNVAKVMTQVFHSGAILDSKTVSYAEEIARLDDVGQQNDHIRQLMLRLNKWFHKSIHSGAYDAKLKLAPLPAVDEESSRHASRPEQSVDVEADTLAEAANPSDGALFTLEPEPTATTADVDATVLVDVHPDVHAATSASRGSGRASSMSDAWLAIASAYLSGSGRSFSGDVDFEDVDDRLVAALRASLHRTRA
ncbi:MAG: hypothetical protein KGO50_14760, partial [Myxococcales bacterium]|nr:hypothetical protein [Myxococcales bacterium]